MTRRPVMAGAGSVVMRSFLAEISERILPKHTSQEPLFGKGSSRVRLQILLERQCFVFVRKGAVPNQLPRFEFCRVQGPARVMLNYSMLQMLRRAGVFLIWKPDAADDVDIPHDRSRIAEGDSIKVPDVDECNVDASEYSARLRPAGFGGLRQGK